MALFRTDYSGRGELSERQHKASLFCTRSKIMQFTDDLTACSGIEDHITVVVQVLIGL